MRLIDCAKILRSKNAGPLYMTFDIIFHNKADMKAVFAALTKKQIAEAYQVAEESVSIIVYGIVDSIKITFPRKHISGSLAEDDVYGCQQHMPLANLEVQI